MASIHVLFLHNPLLGNLTPLSLLDFNLFYYAEAYVEEEGASILNQTTRDWHTRPVILREAKGLAARFFAALKMTLPKGRVAKCTNVMGFDLGWFFELTTPCLVMVRHFSPRCEW